MRHRNRLPRSFYGDHDALYVAENLIGKILVRNFGAGRIVRSRIVETEAYLGKQDRANHASKGKTKRTKVMFEEGGRIYVYLIYGRYWLLNIVTGPLNSPQAVLIRGVEDCSGPGRIGRWLELDRSFYGEHIIDSERIWIENDDSEFKGKIITSPRVGVDYAGPVWKDKLWRFVGQPENGKKQL